MVETLKKLENNPHGVLKISENIGSMCSDYHGGKRKTKNNHTAKEDSCVVFNWLTSF